MISTFQPESVQLPYVVSLLGALHDREITAKEYYGAQRVAALEDSIKKPIYETTWSKVEVGDTVLLPWLSLDRIVKAEIDQCTVEPDCVSVVFDCFGLWGRRFDPDETVYVQSRF